MSREVFALSREISDVATDKISEIQKITASTRILALNAKIEAMRAGDMGRGFSVVAEEVKEISGHITEVADDLKRQVSSRSKALDDLWRSTVTEVRGNRLADLAFSIIDIIDRNLYERSCDVRWWATDSAVVSCLQCPGDDAARHASGRLGVILDSYTVYLDLWVVDERGTVVANGRPDRYPRAVGTSVGDSPWFREAMATRDGTEFAVADIRRDPALDNRPVATYATAIRENGEADGRRLGVLGIFFDWEPQAQTVVTNVRLEDDEKAKTRVLLVDSGGTIIAASDGVGVLKDRFVLDPGGRPAGSYVDLDGNVVGFALTPGYETYAGLGWYGVLVQSGGDA